MRSQKRIAADLLKVGVNRIRFIPEAKEEIAMAITREDIRTLIAKGSIYALPAGRSSRGRIRKLRSQKKKGRRLGPGSRKGAAGARAPKKVLWMRKIRAIRRELKALRASGKINPNGYLYPNLLVLPYTECRLGDPRFCPYNF